MSRNYVEDLLSSEELKEYQDKDWPDNVSILYSALKKKLEVDPDYEVWVPAYYVPCTGFHQKEGEFNTYHLKRFLISNKGKLISNKGQRNYTRTTVHGENRYLTTKLKENGNYISIRMHRMVGCSFIPIPEELREYSHNQLWINHKDTFKRNNGVSNIEWSTPIMNNQHAVENNLVKRPEGSDHYKTKAVLGEVILKGKYLGFKFILSGNKDVLKLLKTKNVGNVMACCNGHREFAKGCKWKHATEQEIEEYGSVVIPDELAELIRNSHSKNQFPILVTRLSGGHQTTWYSREDNKDDFDWGKVRACIRGVRESHKGHTFKLIEE